MDGRVKRRKHDANDIFTCGETGMIQRVGGAEDTKRFLANLGFVDGAAVTVISELNGNLIVNIRDSRVAINKEMAKHVMVQ